MSDVTTDAPAAPPSPPPAAPPEPAPAAPLPDTADATDWATTDPKDFATWPDEAKSYVQRLRDENKTRREELKPYQEVFSTLHPQDRDFMLGMMNALQTRDPEKIAPYAQPFREFLDQLSPADQKAVVKAAEEAAAGGDAFDPYDTDALDKRLEAKLEERLAKERTEREDIDRQREHDRTVNEWRDKLSARGNALAEEHGIEQFKDPTSTLGALLYVTANNRFKDEPDPMRRLDLAAQAIKEDLGSQAQALLKAKAADASPSPVPADAAAPSGAKKPQTLKDAGESARARIDKIFSGQGVGT